MTMSLEHERWAEALHVEKTQGANAPRYVAEQIGRLAIRGDRAGVARWTEIASRLDALRPSALIAN